MTTPSTTASPLTGTFRVPGDKSVSHRAVMFSAIAQGESRIDNLALNADVTATRRCFEKLGAKIAETGNGLTIQGSPWLKDAGEMLDAANSGTTMRLMSGILAAQAFTTTMTGDASLQKRPMGRIIAPLSAMNARIESIGGDNKPPLRIEPSPGGLNGIHYEMPMASAQVKSAVMLAGLYARGETTLIEPLPSRDHTERMLRYAGVELNVRGNAIALPGGQIESLQGRHWQVPGDSSSAAFLTVAALGLPGSEIRIADVGLNPGRIGFIDVLRRAGADIRIENAHEACGEPVGELLVKYSPLGGDLVITEAEVPALIDELPILAVAALLFEGSLTVTGAEELRHKESDRIAAMAAELAKAGYAMETRADGFYIQGRGLQTAEPTQALEAHHDHRIAMSLMTLNRIAAPGTRWAMDGREWVNVSYPGFETVLFGEAR